MRNNETKPIHLICRSTGAEKTTYSRELADDLNQILFSIDESMVTLFGENVPKSMSPDGSIHAFCVVKRRCGQWHYS